MANIMDLNPHLRKLNNPVAPPKPKKEAVAPAPKKLRLVKKK
tara:strand:+ start:932 stop:1057 length:126 start_codon:yes stop_codon:yes gene_type:complete